MSGIVKIAQVHRDVILDAAARAYPNECCGLLEGVDDATGLRIIAVHETANISETPRRNFLVDPQAQLDLMRALRGGERRLAGCFHSHPDGPPAPSETDRAQAFESNFLYLIASGTPQTGFQLNAFRFDAVSNNFEKLTLTI